MRGLTAALAEGLAAEEDGSLRRAFAVWLRRVLLPNRNHGGEFSDILPLEEFRDMLEQTVRRWERQLFRQGREEGREEGVREGLKHERRLLLRQLELKFGPLDAAVERRVRAADSDQLLAWAERLVLASRLEDVFAS